MSSDVSAREQLIDKLRLAGRQLSAATVMFHQAVADRLGLHTTDHKCLDFLHLKGPLTAGELADMTGLTTGAITGVIDRLEEAGFARREEDACDRRRVIVRALPDRCQELGRLFGPLAERMGELCARYSDEELSVIVDFQTRAQQVLREATLELREKPSGRGKRAKGGGAPG